MGNWGFVGLLGSICLVDLKRKIYGLVKIPLNRKLT